MNLCFVSHFAYGAIAGGVVGHVGGVERQCSLLAKWFASRGHKVSLLTWDEGQAEDLIIDGVHIIKICNQSAGVPGIRFIYPRWVCLNKALHKANAEIYYQNCGEHITGQVAMWCQNNKRAFVFSSASDTDCDPRHPTMHKIRDRLLYRYGLRNANAIITQTTKQQKNLYNGINLPSVVLPMPCPGPDPASFQKPVFPAPKSSFHISWAARISTKKRLEILIHVARTLPDVIFEVAGEPSGGTPDKYSSTILEEARSLPNVILHGRINREDMPSFYNRLQLFCCTSEYEGFPNTFLEAWSHGLPIVTTFDPDDLVANLQLGIVVTKISELTKSISFFIDNPEEWRSTSTRAREFYLQNYTVDKVMVQYENLFDRVLAKQSKHVA